MSRLITSGRIVLCFLLANFVCGCARSTRSDTTKDSDSSSNATIVSGVLTNGSQLSIQEVVDQAELIVTANMGLMAGSRVKAISLKNVEVLRGTLATRRGLIVSLSYHHLVLSHRKDKFILFLSKAEKVTDDTEFRTLVGGEMEPAGLQLATEANLEKVREAIRKAKNGTN